MRKIILSFLFLFLVLSGFSQTKIKQFSADSSAFFKEMEEFLTASRKEDGKLVMDEFSWDWFGGKFTQDQRDGVYMMANLMLNKKKKPFPDFKNYLFTISRFVNSKYQTPESFSAWQDILEKLVDDKDKNSFSKYLESCNSLFEENALYKSEANTWKANNNNYKFGFDSLPTIEFNALHLTCYSKGDSSVILNTKGIYYPTLGKWVGTGGKITWERAAYSPDSVFAEINNYTIAFKTPAYEIENVTFYDYLHFAKPLKGKLEEKVLAGITEEKASYPRFESYDKRLKIKDIAKDVDYIGGFAMHGRKVIGRGDQEQNAFLIFYKNDLPFIRIGSKAFVIRPEKIVSDIAATTIFIKSDSIFHPGLSFKFFIDERRITLIRDNQGIKITPYFNSYHQVDMDFEMLTWNLGDPLIQFGNLVGGTKTDATFSSSNFFKLNIYQDLAGMSDQNPLYLIKNMVEKFDTNFLTVEQVSNFMRLSKEQSVSLLLNLTYAGFIIFDYDNMNFIVKNKLIDWVKSSAGKLDYDVINFFSNIKGASNATLSLLNYDLTLRGVNSVHMSDSQQVTIYPNNQELILKKNRDFDFSGVIQAGRFDIMGSNFSFIYDEFKFNMPNVDSLRIYAETGQVDDLGKPIIKPVKTVINKINGDLLIDKPNNKSGIIPIPQYPILNSFNNSYVFYDKKNIQQGAYKRDNFYFDVKPFTIDSLDNFTNSSLKFDGTFISAGIFPDFEETLKLQPDHSLGFVRKTPPDGYPMYGGKGQFTNEINMSHNGLKGDGKLDYVASTTYSNEFIFLPDSMHAVAQKFIIKENPVAVEFPPAEGLNVKTVWHPKKDYMIHKQITEPIRMYDMKSVMHGQTKTTPEGLFGKGIFEFEKAEMESNEIKFKFNEFFADTADFRLKDAELAGELSFATKNVNAYVSFKERFGQFKSNGEGSVIEFPQNQYICYMDEFKWFMDTDGIELSAGEQKTTDASGVKLDGAQFISVHPQQDSLSFFSSKATYDLKKKVIDAKGVKFMNVADAMVYPDSGNVIVDKQAKMRILNNSKVVASYVTQNHHIYNSTINVFGKRKYAGSGYIDYIDELESSQTIYLENIGVDTTGQTYATGAIADTANFKLSPFYEYRGNVKLFANNEFLTFDGRGRIFHDCNLLNKDWFTFESQINPKEIYIPIDSTTQDEIKNKLYAGIYSSPDSLGIYTSFLNHKKKYSHLEVIRATGYLYYDKENSEYKISNKDKLQEMSFAGNYLSLNTKNCKSYAEGKINLSAELGQVDISSAGTITQNLIDNDVVFDLIMLIDFFFNEDALRNISKKMQQASALDPAKLDRPVFEKGLRDVIGKTEADKLIAQANLYGEFKKLPDELKKALVFNDIKFKWDDVNKRYKSISKIGIGNIGKEQVNKYVDGKVEIVKKRSGDILNIYLEIDKNNWYFFNYTRGMMQAISSDADFNTLIQETKPDKRKAKAEKGQEPYQFMYSSDKKKIDFLRKFDE